MTNDEERKNRNKENLRAFLGSPSGSHPFYLVFFIKIGLYQGDGAFVRYEAQYKTIDLTETNVILPETLSDIKLYASLKSCKYAGYSDKNGNFEVEHAYCLPPEEKESLKTHIAINNGKIKNSYFSKFNDSPASVVLYLNDVISLIPSKLKCVSVEYSTYKGEAKVREPKYSKGVVYEVIGMTKEFFIIDSRDRSEYRVPRDKLEKEFNIEVSSMNFEGKRVVSNIPAIAKFEIHE